MKIKKFFNNTFLYSLLFIALFYGANAKANYENCGITFQEPFWSVQNSDGSNLLIVDKNGNMDIFSEEVKTNTTPLESVHKSVIITNNANAKAFIFNAFRAYVAGDIITEQNSIADGSGSDLVVKNNAGTNVARFETGTGDIYLAGKVCYEGIEDDTDDEDTDGIQISSCEELQMIGNDDAYPLDGDYVLTDKIDCSATSTWNPNGLGGYNGFNPIGDNTTPFIGTFDSKGYEIDGLFINRSDEDYVGLFGYIDNTEFKNLGLTNVNIAGKHYTGGLVGYNNSGTITASYVSGDVNGYHENTGGLVGYNNSGTITASYTIGNTAGNSEYGSFVGGLVGYNYYGNIISSYTTNGVSGNDCIGGLIGLNNHGTIAGSYFIGTINNSLSSEKIGGLLGYNYYGDVTDSYATGDVSTDNYTDYVGGLVGYNDRGTITNSCATGNVSGDNYLGGLVGYTADGSIENSYTTGNVSGGGSLGGLVGKNVYTSDSIINCYATGNISGSNFYLGGLVGQNNGAITNSYATGNVSDGSMIGGFIGWKSNGTITNSYYNTETSGQTSACGSGDCTDVISLTTASMIEEVSYPNWTFLPTTDADWKLDQISLSGDYYPCLSWQEDATCILAQ